MPEEKRIKAGELNCSGENDNVLPLPFVKNASQDNPLRILDIFIDTLQ